MKLKSLLQENVQLDYVDSPDQLESITDVVDVTGYVDLFYRNFTSLPVKFGKVNSYFNCSNNQLTSLKGCPVEVGGSFNCIGNRLTSLVGIHKLIKKMNGIFYVRDNHVKEGGIGLLLIDGLKDIYADQPAFGIIEKYLSQGKMGILACQEDLIENGYEDFAKL